MNATTKCVYGLFASLILSAVTIYRLLTLHSDLELQVDIMTKIHQSDQDQIVGYQKRLNSYAKSYYKECGNMWLLEGPEIRIIYSAPSSETKTEGK